MKVKSHFTLKELAVFDGENFLPDGAELCVSSGKIAATGNNVQNRDGAVAINLEGLMFRSKKETLR